MDYIEVEQFLEQPEKVQKSLREWFKGNMQPYNFYKTTGKRSDIIFIKDKSQIEVIKDFINDVIPLLTETQLRRFIEDKTGGKVDLAFFDEDEEHKGYLIEVWTYKPYERIKKFEYLSDDLLQAYWKVACMIAEEIEGK